MGNNVYLNDVSTPWTERFFFVSCNHVQCVPDFVGLFRITRFIGFLCWFFVGLRGHLNFTVYKLFWYQKRSVSHSFLDTFNDRKVVSPATPKNWTKGPETNFFLWICKKCKIWKNTVTSPLKINLKFLKSVTFCHVYSVAIKNHSAPNKQKKSVHPNKKSKIVSFKPGHRVSREHLMKLLGYHAVRAWYMKEKQRWNAIVRSIRSKYLWFLWKRVVSGEEMLNGWVGVFWILAGDFRILWPKVGLKF